MNSRYERPARPQRRVVITGIGAVTPLGLDMETTWKNALAGQSGISNITKFDSTAYDVHFAGEVKGFNPDLYIEKKEQKKMDAFIHYALASTKMAIANANIEWNEEWGNKTGCMIGAGMGGLPMIEEQFEKLREKGPGRITPFFIPAIITNLASGQVSIAYGMKGPNYSITSACATGAHSIGEAARYVRDGMCEVMVAGGTEATVCKMAIGGFAAMRALSTRNDNPQAASRPWDEGRDGFVLAEGAAVVVIETLEHAEKRGAPIICEITGYGATSDGYHMTSPAPEGAGGAAAMRMAIAEAGIKTSDISYINAHGTSTPVGDGLETLAIKNVFGSDAKKVWVSSTKSMTGHTLGAAGAIETAFCALALKHQIVPPTINLDKPSPDCDLDYVPKQAREGKILHALNNSFGFGGTNASLILSRL